jgi:hypothetical protein
MTAERQAPGETLSWADLAERYPAPGPRITIRGGYLTIRTEDHLQHGDEYAFELKRIDTPMKLLEWTHHLAGKGWCDAFLTRELIEKVCKHFGWNLFAGC